MRGRSHHKAAAVAMAALALTVAMVAAPVGTALAGTAPTGTTHTGIAPAGTAPPLPGPGPIPASPSGPILRPAGAVLAAHPPWRIKRSPNATLPGGQLEAISCSAASACTAVGTALSTSGRNTTLAERWNGTSWRHQSTPRPGDSTVPTRFPELFGVSCPAARFCEAVGSYDVGAFGLVSLAEAWNGRRWTIQHFPAPTGSTLAGLTQVSCTSARFCESVGFYENLVNERLAFAARWNGTTWRLQHMPNPTNAQFSEIGSLSCVSARFCEASGGTDAPSPLVEQWNGQSWRLQHVPMDVGPLSCVSATFCAGTGAVWNGSSWSAQTIPRPAGATSVIAAAVSCVSSAFCEAVGRYQTSSGSTLGLAATWNGTSWALQPIPSRASAAFTSLNAVSCASTTACEAGGDFILIDTFFATTAPVAMAEAWNGSTWSLQHRVAPPGAASNVLSGVSCVSAVFCEAVGSHPDRSGAATVALAEVWTGTRWKIQRTPDPATASNGTRMSLTGVSCVSRRFCEAVGFSSGPGGGGAEKWNGTAWKLQAIPGGDLTSVSCTSVTFCMAAGGDGHVDTWNGSSWSAQASATGFTSLKSVSCASRRSCEAVGFGPSGDEAEGWNGSTWSPQATPTPAGGSSVDLLAVSCAGTTSCEAVGWYFNSTFEQVTLAESWNGTAWKPQPIPSPATSPGSIALLDAVWCVAADACAAVGHFTPFFSDLALVEVWNGKQWRLRTASSFPYAAQNDLNGVSCATSRACTAVGVTDDIGGVAATLIETGN